MMDQLLVASPLLVPIVAFALAARWSSGLVPPIAAAAIAGSAVGGFFGRVASAVASAHDPNTATLKGAGIGLGIGLATGLLGTLVRAAWGNLRSKPRE